jgi:outer membrane protein OmpA-like peptidoglycan-associated protein
MSNSDEINVANQVAAASGQPPKISLEQVVNNPQILDDCQNKIYFPNATSFAHDSDQITPEFERQLEQLAKLRDQFPNRLLIVTGHSDRMGDETEAGVVHNLDLSRRRANSVAQWFATHSQWTLEQMQVEGIGSDAPLLDLPGDVPVNRRVEINLNCR